MLFKKKKNRDFPLWKTILQLRNAVYRPVFYPERNNLKLLQDRAVGRSAGRERKTISSLSNINNNSFNNDSGLH